MYTYNVKSFNIPSIIGISEKQVKIHLGLYEGYVKHVNTILEELEKNPNVYIKNELKRRFSFEYSGMKAHEKYFYSLQGGAKDLPNDELRNKIETQYGTFENLIEELQNFASTIRGVGWVLLKYDVSEDLFHITWVTDHELGNVPSPTVLAIDMWEHAYMNDYEPKEKSAYVSAYLSAINWETVSGKFSKMVK